MKKVNGEWDKALVYDQRVYQVQPAKIRSIPNTWINKDSFKPTLKLGKKVKSQDSPVPRKVSDITGGCEIKAPNTAWSVS